MSTRNLKNAGLAALCVALFSAFAAPLAQAAPNDPLFLLRPIALFQRAKSPPPSSTFEGPCGLATDSTGQVYVSDYYHDTINIFGPDINGDHDNEGKNPRYGYRSQIADTDPVNGPCGLAVDGAGGVYVNEYHRSVVKVGTGVITGAPVDAARPTGVAVDPVTERLYVNDRDHIAIFDLAGAPLGQIGTGSLVEGYGLAVSRHKDSLGYILAPDAATNTVKVYAPTPGGTVPTMTIDGSETPLGEFISLKDAGIAVDNESGEIYVSDNVKPEATEKPETVVYVFDSKGKYKGRLKYSVVFSQSVGLAVDNSATANRGRVYVTSGNIDAAAVYGYPPNAAADEAFPLPEPKNIEPEDEGYDPGEGSGTQSAAVSTSAGPSLAAAALRAPTVVDSAPALAPATAKPGLRAKKKKKNTSKRRRARIARVAR